MSLEIPSVLILRWMTKWCLMHPNRVSSRPPHHLGAKPGRVELNYEQGLKCRASTGFIEAVKES
jgi:hypothetical protein